MSTPQSFLARHVFLSGFILSMAACAFVFFDLFWNLDQNFMWHHDTEVPFESVFSFVSYFFQGGFQLFDRYDGMTLAFNQLGHGVYGVSNICTAVVYIIFSPFFDLPGRDFHHVYSVVFHAFNILIRTLGGYILLRKFKLSPIPIVISLVILNTFLSSSMYLGLDCNNLYSYYPLLAYFILNFTEHFRLKDLLAIIALMTVAVAGLPLLALGYFYQNVNFLMVTGLIYGLVFHRRNIHLKDAFNPDHFKKCFGVLGLCALILLPTVFMAKILTDDFYVHGSGLGGTHGRLNNVFNPAKYFSFKGESILPLPEFPFKAIDFTNSTFEKSWIFFGASVLIFILFGLICSRHRQKYIFLSTAILILLTNTPLDPSSPLSIAHWINVLTHPFSFLIRSYHMPVLLLPYVIFPLVAFGVQAAFEIVTGSSAVRRLPVLMGVIVGGMFLSMWFLLFPLKAYVLLMFVLALLFLYVFSSREDWFWGVKRIQVGVLFLVVFMTVDVLALREYYINNEYRGGKENRDGFVAKNDGRHTKPYVFEGFEDGRLLLLEYQNPKILPFREYFRTLPSVTDPYLHTQQGLFGAFYRYVPLERYFMGLDMYTPRPMMYKDMALNRGIYRALAQDQRFIFLAQGSEDGPHQVLAHRVRTFPLPLGPQVRKFKQGDMDLYKVRLPKDFPRYEATALFTEDRLRLSFVVDGKQFLPVQGAIAEPYGFDVNNMKDGYLIFSVPQGVDVYNGKAELALRQSGDILDIWKNTDDELGFTFKAASDGWLVIHQPYDPKWQAIVDGNKVDIKQVNGYFLGVQLSQGEHKVLFRYWPGSPLRFFIPLSMVLVLVTLVYLFAMGLKATSEGNP